MTKIRINPEELNATSQKIAGIQQRLSGLGGELMRISGTAPSYQGQFLPRVLGLSSQAHLKVIYRSNQLGNQSSRLAKIATRFAQADSGFGQSGGLSDLFNNFIDKLRGFFGGVSPTMLFQLGTIFSLGTLFATPAPWNPSPAYAVGESSNPGQSISFKGSNSKIKVIWEKIQSWYWNLILRPVNSSIPIGGPRPPHYKETKEKIVYDEPVIQYDPRIGEYVKKNIGGDAELGYTPRGSNCTWFAAQAVLYKSDGKIQINKWGEAGNWRQMAVNEMNKGEAGFVTGIDKEPQAGDILYGPPGEKYKQGHVAYVESVEGEGANRVVTFVEEHAGGYASAWPPAQSETIIIDGQPQRRWRVKVKLSTLINPPYNVEFIHLRY